MVKHGVLHSIAKLVADLRLPWGGRTHIPKMGGVVTKGGLRTAILVAFGKVFFAILFWVLVTLMLYVFSMK
jgi:hypothetical protein